VPVSIANGGTNTATAPANGELLIGNAGNYTVASLTAGTNTFTLNYKTSGATGTWAQRRLTVQGVA
jgi:hypothetical protein